MFPSLPVAGEELARVDRYGDSLPPLALARLGTVRFRHADQIRCLEYSPDGKLLASGGGDNRLYLWEAPTGRKIREFAGHPGKIVSLAFSPDGKTLVSACANYFSDEKKYSEGGLRLWNVATGKLIFQLPKVDEETEIVAFAPDGKTFASGHPSGRTRVWDTATGKLLHESAEECDKERVVALTFAPNGNLVVADNNGTIRVWDVNTEKTLREEKYLEIPHRFAFSPDGKVFATADKEEIRLFCAATLKETFRFQTKRQSNSSMTFTRITRRLLAVAPIQFTFGM
jgi:WD40 repeat protein